MLARFGDGVGTMMMPAAWAATSSRMFLISSSLSSRVSERTRRSWETFRKKSWSPCYGPTSTASEGQGFQRLGRR